MADIPQWVWALLTLGASALGSWGAVKISVARLEVQMERALKDISAVVGQLNALNEDSLVHDMELENALGALKLPRVRRQPARGYDR